MMRAGPVEHQAPIPLLPYRVNLLTPYRGMLLSKFLFQTSTV